MTEDELHAQALAEGYKDEVCPKCGTMFKAHIHFIKCGSDPCPMKSTTDPRSVLDIIFGETQEPTS